MSRFLLRRPSGGTLIAAVALFVALGGTAYAALSLPKNSVGSKQLKNNAVTTSKIKNGAVTAGKINTSGLTVPNAKTAATANGQGTLASGKTEIGIIGGVFQNGPTVASPMAIAVTFPLLAPVALSGSNIEVAPTASCTGSTANPKLDWVATSANQQSSVRAEWAYTAP
jgi:hypothetical protein